MSFNLTDNDRIMNQPLILASGSPRRRELLRQAGYTFQVIVPDESVETGVSIDQPPESYVVKAAYEKTRAVAEQIESGIVLAADTMALCNGQMIGKPTNRQHAEQILRTIMGTTHLVHTGVCLCHRPSNSTLTTIETSVVEMGMLTDLALQAYLDSNQWIGKAGAFGYQDDMPWIKIVAGLESNVVGLPIERLDGWIDELMDRARSN